ncbi:hypothetical protein HKD37_16G045362 [Glycine soja]
MAHLKANRCTPQPTQPETTPFSGSGMHTELHRMNLDVPRFDSSDATGWIFKITQLFEYHTTPYHERLTIVSFYMEGQALAWFQWMHRNGQLSSWPTFLHAPHSRFASATYEDPAELPPSIALSCFISGLNPAIRHEVQVLQPVSQAVAYARLQEEKKNDARRSFCPSSVTGATSSSRPPLLPTPVWG